MAITTYDGLLEAWVTQIEVIEQNLEKLYGPSTITPVLPSVTTEDGMLEGATEQAELAAWNFAKMYSNLVSISGTTYTVTVPSTGLFYGELVSVGGNTVDVSGILKSAPVTKVVSKDAGGNIIDTLVIPAEVQALTGYGWGALNAYNYIDFANKKFVQNVGKIDLGTCTWLTSSSGGVQYYYAQAFSENTAKPAASASDITNVVLAGYTSQKWSDLYYGRIDKSICVRTSSVFAMYDSEIQDVSVEDFTALMSGKYLYYELKVTAETDISAYITNANIKVVPGGTLTFVNENALDVPSEVKYIS